MISITTNFNPASNGFGFVNSFKFPELFNASLPLPIPKSVGSVIYGLCGGMCCAALDYYQDNRPPPPAAEPDNITLKLFRYLWLRQLETLTPPVLEKMFAWTLLDPVTLANKMIEEEIPAIVETLRGGSPALLVLVRSQSLLHATENHQVLAVEYELTADQRHVLSLYDPNHPGALPTLTLKFAKPTDTRQLFQSTGEPLRGFYCIQYRHMSPP